MWFDLVCVYYEMISTVRLVNTTITLDNYNLHTCGCVYIQVWRTFKIYSFSNFKWMIQHFLIILSRLYITPLEITPLVTASLSPLITFAHFLSPPTAPTPENYWPTCFSEFSFWDSTWKWDHTVSVSIWLTSLSTVTSRSIHVVGNFRISFLLKLNDTLLCICVCVCITFPYSFICRRTLGVLPHLDYYKQHCSEHRSADMSSTQWFISFDSISRGGTVGSHIVVFNFLRKFHTVFHCGRAILHSHWQNTSTPFSPHPHSQLCRSEIWHVQWVLSSENHKTEIMVSANLNPPVEALLWREIFILVHSSYWQNSFPCNWKTDFPISLLYVSRGCFESPEAICLLCHMALSNTMSAMVCHILLVTKPFPPGMAQSLLRAHFIRSCSPKINFLS